jgi:ATP-dependent helicase/DNAse subunit B
VPLTLVTGPANAEKARVVLDGVRAALARSEDPVLVVPTLADVERYRAELAAGGAVFGTSVVRFAWLLEEAARRGGVGGRALSSLARERVAAAAVARTPLRALARSAQMGGFVPELLRLVDELEELRVTPQRLTQALRAWAGQDAGRRAYGDEVAALYGAYRRGLERLGRLDAPLFAAAALDALRERPAAWGQTPVFLYGFDDLQPLQLDAVETLAATGAQVTLSLSFERGRRRPCGRATAFAELHREGVRHVALKARAGGA